MVVETKIRLLKTLVCFGVFWIALKSVSRFSQSTKIVVSVFSMFSPKIRTLPQGLSIAWGSKHAVQLASIFFDCKKRFLTFFKI